MTWLLGLYPPAWQRRYRLEVEAHLEAAGPLKLRTALDLVAGAIDAWRNPRSIPDTTQDEEETQMGQPMPRCQFDEIPTRDAVRSAVWMLGLTLALTVLGTALDKTIGDSVFIKALLYSAFFIAFTVSSRITFLKDYSATARNVITVVAVVGWYVFFLGVTAFAAAT